MAESHDVALFTGTEGLQLIAWDRYDLTLDMMGPGSPWTVSLWHSEEQRSAWNTLRAGLKLLDRMFWSIDGATQVNGRLETLDTKGSRAGAVMILSGRDMAGAAIDGDADPTLRLKALPLDAALAALFAPLGISVRIGANVDAARQVQNGTRRGPRDGGTSRRRNIVDQSHPQPGEKVWQLAETIVRRLGYMIWCAPDPEAGLAVVVDVPAFNGTAQYQFTRRNAGGPVWTGNILDGGEALNARDMPTAINVYTHAPRGDATSARQATVVPNAAIVERAINRGFLIDPLPEQPRHVHAPRARTLEAAGQEGARLMSDSMAKFRQYTCTVQGHGQLNGGGEMRLYAVNTMAHVTDDLCTDPTGAALSEDMLITKVQFSGSRQGGQTTQLTLIPKDSILLVPSAE